MAEEGKEGEGFLSFLKQRKFWVYIGKRALVAVICIIIAALSATLSANFDEIADIMISIASNIIIFTIAFDLFSLLYLYEKNLERKEMLRNNLDIDQSLFNWSGRLEFSDKIIYDLFSKNNPEKSMENLFALKEKVKIACLNDKENFYLLKKYMELKNKENSNGNTRSILITAGIGIIVTIVTQLNSKHNFIVFLHNAVIDSKKVLTTSSLITYITYCTYGLIALMGFLFLREILTKSKARLRVVSMVVDSCINDIKEE